VVLAGRAILPIAAPKQGHDKSYFKSVDVKSSKTQHLIVLRNTKNLKPRELVALNIRRLRAQQGISQEELADRARLHRTYIGSIERSERNVSIDNIAKLADALGVKIIELFTEPTT
jgi:ribosome-binding protein aMBF1 (putative translation factor)